MPRFTYGGPDAQDGERYLTSNQAAAMLPFGVDTLCAIFDAENSPLSGTRPNSERRITHSSVLRLRKTLGLDEPNSARVATSKIGSVIGLATMDIYPLLRAHHTDLKGSNDTRTAGALANTRMCLPGKTQWMYIVPDHSVWHFMLECGIPAKVVKMVQQKPKPIDGVPEDKHPILYSTTREELDQHMQHLGPSLIRVILDPRCYDSAQHAEIQAFVGSYYKKHGWHPPNMPTPAEVRALEKRKIWEDRPIHLGEIRIGRSEDEVTKKTA